MIPFAPDSSRQANSRLRIYADPIDRNYGLRRPASISWKMSIPVGIMLIPLVLLKPMFAQSSLTGVLGIPSDASTYPIPGLGFVNLNNGNLHIEIPVRVVKDRNGSPVTTSLTYDNSVWYQIQVKSPNWTPQNPSMISEWSTTSNPPYPGSQVLQTGFNISTTPNYVGNVTSQEIRDRATT